MVERPLWLAWRAVGVYWRVRGQFGAMAPAITAAPLRVLPIDPIHQAVHMPVKSAALVRRSIFLSIASSVRARSLPSTPAVSSMNFAS